VKIAQILPVKVTLQPYFSRNFKS